MINFTGAYLLNFAICMKLVLETTSSSLTELGTCVMGESDFDLCHQKCAYLAFLPYHPMAILIPHRVKCSL